MLMLMKDSLFFSLVSNKKAMITFTPILYKHGKHENSCIL